MFEEFYQKYETEEQEVIALIRKCIGAGYHKSDNSDFWEMTVITLGMVFCNTGKVSIKEGRLKWPVTEEERNSEKSWGRLQQGQICRLKVRRLLDGLHHSGTVQQLGCYRCAGAFCPLPSVGGSMGGIPETRKH